MNCNNCIYKDSALCELIGCTKNLREVTFNENSICMSTMQQDE